jgi:hypothetical protein
MAAVLYGEVFGVPYPNRVVLALLAPLLGYVLNAVRIVVIVVMEDISTHTTQGIVLLVVGVLVIAAIASGLEKINPGPGRPANPSPPDPARRLQPRRMITAAAALLVLSAASFGTPRFEGETSLAHLRRFPREFDSWTASRHKIDWMFLGTVRFYEDVSYDFRRGSDSVWVYVGTDDFSDHDRSFLSEKTLVFTSGAVVLNRDEFRLAETNQRVDRVLMREIRHGEYVLVYRWYSGVGSVLEETLRSLFALDHSLFQRVEGGTMVRLSTVVSNERPSDEDLELARARLDEFVSHVGQALETMGSKKS